MPMTIQPAAQTPPDRVHGLSHHPIIKALLARGLNHLWTHKELAEVLGLGDRTVQYMAETAQIPAMAFQGRGRKPGANRKARRFSTTDCILYLLGTYEGAMDTATVVNILAPLLTQLPDSVLTEVEAACQKIRRRRAGQLVIATNAPAAMPKTSARLLGDADQLDLFACQIQA